MASGERANSFEQPPAQPAAPSTSPQQRADSMDACQIQAHEDQCAEEHRFTFTKDAFTNMMVSFLEVQDEKSKCSRVGGQGISVAVVVFSAVVQLVSAIAVYSYVTQARLSRLDIIDDAYGLFLTSNETMPIAISQKICGEYEQVESSQGLASILEMPDGTLYKPTGDMPTFYSNKLPRGWDFRGLKGDMGSILDEALFISQSQWHKVGDLVTLDLNLEDIMSFPVLFHMMLTIWVLNLMIEIRDVGRFTRVTVYFLFKQPPEGCVSPLTFKDGTRQLVFLTRSAKIAGIFISIVRISIVAVLSLCGTSFLIYTSSTLELIMNSLALAFILEVDNILFKATASTSREYIIEDLQAVRYPAISESYAFLANVNQYAKIWHPIVMITIAISLSMICRNFQRCMFLGDFKEVATVCMFMGPVPYGMEGLLAPATGMCESLVQTTCAPSVTGSGASHGHCLVTDKAAFNDPTVKMHVDGKLYERMADENGRRLMPKDWGPPRPELESNLDWQYGYMDDIRKACITMYQPGGSTDAREVDKDTGETMDGAPFYCPKHLIFDEIFGETIARKRAVLAEQREEESFDAVDHMEHAAEMGDWLVPGGGQAVAAQATGRAQRKARNMATPKWWESFLMFRRPVVLTDFLEPRVQEAMLRCRMGSEGSPLLLQVGGSPAELRPATQIQPMSGSLPGAVAAAPGWPTGLPAPEQRRALARTGVPLPRSGRRLRKRASHASRVLA